VTVCFIDIIRLRITSGTADSVVHVVLTQSTTLKTLQIYNASRYRSLHSKARGHIACVFYFLKDTHIYANVSYFSIRVSSSHALKKLYKSSLFHHTMVDKNEKI